MGTNGENIQLDISGKYPCSFQGNITRIIEFKIENDQSLLQFFVIPLKFLNKIDINLLEMYIKIRSINQDNLFRMNDQHGYHMNLLAQNYGFAIISQPHYAYSATHGIHQSFGVGLNEHENRSFAECSSCQRHNKSSHNQYEIREDEATFDLCNYAHAQRSDKILRRMNLQKIMERDVSKMQNNDIPYFTTLENGEDIVIFTREFEMKCCSIWFENAKKDLEKDMCFSSKAKLKWFVTSWSLLKNKEFKVVISSKSLWTVRCRFYDSLGRKVTAMVRLSLEQIIERYTGRCQTAHQLVEQKELVYEVRSIQIDGTGGNPQCVSLSEKKCDCEKWANLHFPCSHVIKVTKKMRALARNFVSEHFTTENYIATYSGSFSPIGHEAYWPSPSFIMRSNEFYCCPNRSRTTRIPNEMDRDPAVYGRACRLCRHTGHNRCRCPTQNQT
ncbi:hypothetical protein H5410_033210 [Solanum commersonii]|uniref:SWIM-type domain-containing protein n=1 Tax=Solanum commersonii TaxID=4109 RepID=A0A9J5YQ40_SOLCO|nr:hypothetical protein H5410_033210 [Solanum commersonii]